jgi:serine/threonine-protein kinase RsbT
MSARQRIAVGHPVDVEIARRAARTLAQENGFSRSKIDDIVVAVSELATNLLRYANEGKITLAMVSDAERAGMLIESRDTGPGIADLDLALQDGYGTGGSYGDGLPIARRLMDDMRLDSSPAGTVIVAYKWI